MPLGGAFSNFIHDDLANQQQAARTQAIVQEIAMRGEAAAAERQAREAALAAQRNQGAIFGAMYPGAAPALGLPPPPPGTPAGGPMPPGIHQASEPMQPPAARALPPMPPPPPPPGMLPPPPMAGGAGPAPAPQAGGAPAAAPPIPPFRPIPAAPPMAQAGGMPAIPPPPMQAPPPGATPQIPGAGAQPPSFMQRFVQAMRTAGVPQEQWGAQLANLPPIVKETVSQEIKGAHDAQAALVKQAELILKEREIGRKEEQGNRRIEQKDRQIDKMRDWSKKVNVAGMGAGDAGKDAAADDVTSDQAWRYLTTGNLPYRKGTGGGADRNDKVLKEATRIRKELGMTPEEIAAMPAEFKSNASSLTMQTKKFDAISAQLNSFHNNIETWDKIAQGLPPTLGGEAVKQFIPQLQAINFTGIRSFDDVKLRIQSQFNDPTVAAYLVSAMAVAMDYARIMSGPQSAAQLTEGARKDAERLIAAGTNNEARKGVIAALDSDTEGQRQGLEKQIKETRDRLRGGARKLPGDSGRTTAPQAALDYLKAHPETKAAFSAKYGYLPADAR